MTHRSAPRATTGPAGSRRLPLLRRTALALVPVLIAPAALAACGDTEGPAEPNRTSSTSSSTTTTMAGTSTTVSSTTPGNGYNDNENDGEPASDQGDGSGTN